MKNRHSCKICDGLENLIDKQWRKILTIYKGKLCKLKVLYLNKQVQYLSLNMGIAKMGMAITFQGWAKRMLHDSEKLVCALRAWLKDRPQVA